MAVYLPGKHVILDIVDDPCSAPVDREAFPGLPILPVTCRQLADERELDRLIRRARWTARHRPGISAAAAAMPEPKPARRTASKGRASNSATIFAV